MTSGISKTAILIVAMLGTAAWTTPPCAAAPPPEAAPGAIEAPALVASLKRAAPARTTYTEVRFSGLLERPLILHGVLEYLGPGRLGKRVDSPYVENITISDSTAAVQRGDSPARSFALGQVPELEGFLRGFSALLGGDSSALARDFTLAVSGTSNSWQLSLKPRDRHLQRRIREIEVDGSGNTPRCFRTHETDGDDAVMLVDTLADTKLPTRVSQAQLDALCRGLELP